MVYLLESERDQAPLASVSLVGCASSGDLWVLTVALAFSKIKV